MPLSPLPNNWKRIDSADLRQVIPDAVVLSIIHEIDGPSMTFGERLWGHITLKNHHLAERLNGSTPITAVRYVDRYLRSPFTILLLHSVLKDLCRYPGGATPSTAIRVETTLLERFDMDIPRLFFHDWRDNDDRKCVIEQWLRETWSSFSWDETTLRELPHPRELTLTWNDGECWFVRFDQGFGYWRTKSGIRCEFPFDYNIERQKQKLKNGNFLIEPANQNYPTYLYCGKHK